MITAWFITQYYWLSCKCVCIFHQILSVTYTISFNQCNGPKTCHHPHAVHPTLAVSWKEQKLPIHVNSRFLACNITFWALIIYSRISFVLLQGPRTRREGPWVASEPCPSAFVALPTTPPPSTRSANTATPLRILVGVHQPINSHFKKLFPTQSLMHVKVTLTCIKIWCFKCNLPLLLTNRWN